MALYLSTAAAAAACVLYPSTTHPQFLHPKPKHLLKVFSFRTFSQSQGTDLSGGLTDQQLSPPPLSGSLASTRTQLDLLDQLTSTTPSSQGTGGYESDGGVGGRRQLTIREHLENLMGEREEDFSIPLGKNLKKISPKFLTVSQKRNIRRQAYLDEVSQRNDSLFFATIAAFVILPPIIILGIAIFNGYVQLFP